MTPAPSRSERLYARLLALYPRAFRAQFGQDLADVFRDQLNDARRHGASGVARFWFATAKGLVTTAFLERVTSRSTIPDTKPPLPMLESLSHDLRFTFRALRKSPVFTAVAMIVIALGTGAVTTIFSAANGLVLKPLPAAARPRELVEIHRTLTDGDGSLSASYPYYKRLSTESRTLTGLAAWSMMPLTVSTGGEGVTLLGNIVSANYFDVIGVRPALGRFFGPDDDRAPGASPVVVVSHGFWTSRLGSDSGIVGRTIRVNGRQFTVIGVAARGFHGVFAPLNTEVWVPMMMQQSVRSSRLLLNDPGSGWLELFGRRRPDASLDAVRADLTRLTIAGTGDEPKDFTRFVSVRVTTLSGLPSDVSPMAIAFIGVLLAVAGIVLLIASANVAGMLLARATTRRREIALRVALGARRLRIVRQMLSESILLFVGGAAGGVLLAFWGTRALEHVPLPVDVPPIALDLTPDLRVLGFALGVALLTGLTFGMAPALSATRHDIMSLMRSDSAGSGTRRSRTRNSLVVGQLALSLVLLISAGLFLRAYQRGQGVRPGFDLDNVTVASFDASTYGYDSEHAGAFYDDLKARLAARPGIAAVSYAWMLPLSGSNAGDEFRIDGYAARGAEAERGVELLLSQVDPDYFSVLRIPVASGRAFAAADGPRSAPVAIVNEAAARRFWPNGNALGGTVHRDSTAFTVVGVVPDTKFTSLSERPRPFIYFPLSQSGRADRILMVRSTGDARTVAGEIRAAVKAIDPQLPVPQVSSMRVATSVVLMPQRIAAMVTAMLGLVGLVLAAVGLYGIVAYSVSQRTREIGVRMALGAARGDVVGMIVREGMRLALIGGAVGMVIALGATRLLSAFLFGVSATDAATFVVIPLVLGAVAALASYVPARRAAAADPLVALRAE